MKAQIKIGQKGDLYKTILFLDSNGDVSQMTVSDIEAVVEGGDYGAVEYVPIRELICAYKMARVLEKDLKLLFNLRQTLNDY